MSHIPEARRLLQSALDPAVDEAARRILILEALKRMTRVRHKPRTADRESRPMTPDLAAAIRRFARENPDLSVRTMADQFDVSIGRVSEAIAGRWDA